MGFGESRILFMYGFVCSPPRPWKTVQSDSLVIVHRVCYVFDPLEASYLLWWLSAVEPRLNDAWPRACGLTMGKRMGGCVQSDGEGESQSLSIFYDGLRGL